MVEARHPRKFAFILHADIVGSSKLVQIDEQEAHARIRDAFRRFSRVINAYDGVVHELRGDALVAVFERASDAVTASISFQRENTEHNQSLAGSVRPDLRVGIGMGEVVLADNTITGPGVVLAQRLEQLAQPGGVIVQGAVQEAVPRRLPFDYESLGEQKFKGFDETLRACAVSLVPGAEIPSPETMLGAGKRTARFARHRIVVAAAASLVLVAAGGILWQRESRETSVPIPVETTSVETIKSASLAVLPFNNLSDDPEQEYFADGMTEDLITDLSKISRLTVISRTTTSAYKGKKVDIREIGEALNVRYVVEGSVRKAGDTVRINAQLVDATTGGDLWAERYDGDLEDIFGLQDQVLDKIVESLHLTLSEKERVRLSERGTQNIAAHDLYLRGLFKESTFTREGNQEAIRLYQQALSIDPDYALPYTRIANILELSTRNGWSDDIAADLAQAVELAEKAVSLDPQDPRTHWSLGRAVARLRTPDALDRGIKALQTAIELDPNFADAYAYLTVLYVADGRAADGLRSVETAMRLNGRYPFWYLFMRGMARYVLEDYDLAITDFETAAERSPTVLFVRWWLAASYAQAGRMEDAEWQVEEMDMLGFAGSIETILETQPIQDPGYLKLYKEGLRKAGLPE